MIDRTSSSLRSKFGVSMSPKILSFLCLIVVSIFLPYAIKEMVTSEEYRHVPTGTLALLAQRLGKVFASASTWLCLPKTPSNQIRADHETSRAQVLAWPALVA